MTILDTSLAGPSHPEKPGLQAVRLGGGFVESKADPDEQEGAQLAGLFPVRYAGGQKYVIVTGKVP
ncbi:hypothetical protein [Paenibacillus ginsengarvi]|uniref:Uncharacterized protein n=1 Tax=Paenibacillus ginsengarvi TaxID=400777 RepID=A0A3B0CIE2_9BACL|nr:hypothetical protein [Paenibacillus ginsengarvi]RKN84334.1 hypothetical protein D7M11_12625 [Paenibacillus ginsengarvi]